MYIVMAYRMGQINGYHYPVGIFNSIKTAKKAAKEHHEYRGGKYNHIIWKCEPSKEYDAGEAKQVWSSCD